MAKNSLPRTNRRPGKSPEILHLKAAGPVTPQELEGLSLRVAQARSTVALLGQHEDGVSSDLHNALGLLELWLDSCAEDLSDLHRRQEAQL